MKCLFLLFLTGSLVISSNTLAFSDTNQLLGTIEKNQLNSLLAANKVNCQMQPNYAQAISKLLAGYDFSNIFKNSVQQNNLQASTKVAKIKATNSKIKSALSMQDILANHDLAIIVDRSGSMAIQDCPGKLSRWQWCARQAGQLAQAAAQASSSITVMFFNSDLQVFDNVDPKDFPALFDNHSPFGGTILASPFVAQLDRYFAARAKPLIVVVITDGIPQDSMDVSAIIRDTSDSLHYTGEVTISFLLIGNQMDADQFKRLIGELDGGEIKNGGMVDVIAFQQVCAKGVKQTLFDELKTIKSTTNKSRPSEAEKYVVGRSLPITSPLNPFPSYAAPANSSITRPVSAYAGTSATNPFPMYSGSSLNNPIPTKSKPTIKKKPHRTTS